MGNDENKKTNTVNQDFILVNIMANTILPLFNSLDLKSVYRILVVYNEIKT